LQQTIDISVDTGLIDEPIELDDLIVDDA